MVANKTGDNVYVAWTDTSSYKFVNITDSGKTQLLDRLVALIMIQMQLS